MKEIGGYFELECSKNPSYHNNAIELNSARNSLRYIIRAYNIKKIYVPKYTCPVIYDAIVSENCQMAFYSIDENFYPKFHPEQEGIKNEFILYTNYYGICGGIVDELAAQYPNLIVDNAQAFYSPKKGIASFYCPRKFFGLPDGGLVISDKHLQERLEQGISYDICSHLLKRHDLSASEAYADFQRNDAALIDQPVRYMSGLTRSLMGNINYNDIRKTRSENFSFLHNSLQERNELPFTNTAGDVPMAYPFLIKNEQLRKKLIDNKIFVATYWPGLESHCDEDSFELYLKKYLLPLPIDQRYGLDEMRFILKFL